MNANQLTNSSYPKEQIKDAISEAQLAFWKVISKKFPDIKTGDLNPVDTIEFDDACENVLYRWFDCNTDWLKND
jgi:hypothetical protein